MESTFYFYCKSDYSEKGVIPSLISVFVYRAFNLTTELSCRVTRWFPNGHWVRNDSALMERAQTLHLQAGAMGVMDMLMLYKLSIKIVQGRT